MGLMIDLSLSRVKEKPLTRIHSAPAPILVLREGRVDATEAAGALLKGRDKG
jgi:hypothetical protein